MTAATAPATVPRTAVATEPSPERLPDDAFALLLVLAALAGPPAAAFLGRVLLGCFVALRPDTVGPDGGRFVSPRLPAVVPEADRFAAERGLTVPLDPVADFAAAGRRLRAAPAAFTFFALAARLPAAAFPRARSAMSTSA